MPSPQYFASSPISPNTQRLRRSKFTYKHLATLAHYATNCPLRVIAHVDLDAFYAQCETVRLGLDPTRPLAVQQWQGLIAINYPARAFGLNRHVTVAEAREKCPELICQHVATWREGETTWSYSEEGKGDEVCKEIDKRKVSLDPYRIESRKILATIKEFLPADKQRVEKASVDEVFIDLSAQIHGILLERYPELKGPPPYDDPTERLPRPSTTALDWAADALVDLDASQSEEDDPDWDDIALLIASEIVRDLRAKVYEKLHYTCSAGLSRNKMLAKLGSGHKKPNSQTVIRNRAVQHFLSEFKFTKIRNLGGKLGDEVVAAFNTDLVSDLLPVSVDQLKKHVGDDTGTWLYHIIRGKDDSEVNPRTQIKSMLSAKAFRPSINTFEVACKWLRIFAADIFSRLVEEGVLENRRRPKTANLHHRQGAQTRSKSAPIASARTMSEGYLFDLAKSLLVQVVADGRAWPCANLSLSVAGFEDGVTGNQGIGGFLVRGEEARALQSTVVASTTAASAAQSRNRSPAIATAVVRTHDEFEEDDESREWGKKRRKTQHSGIAHFFGNSSRQNSADEVKSDEGPSHVQARATSLHTEDTSFADRKYSAMDNFAPECMEQAEEDDAFLPPTSAQPRTDSPSPGPTGLDEFDDLLQTPPLISPVEESHAARYVCPRCKKLLAAEDRTEHEDFHFAQDLQNLPDSPPRIPPPLRSSVSAPTPPPTSATPNVAKRGRGRPPAFSGGPEKGQKRLAFG